VFTTRDKLEDILLETVAVSSDENDDTLLILHDGSVWVIYENGDGYFILHKLGFEQC
jgi:hypothetical protein